MRNRQLSFVQDQRMLQGHRSQHPDREKGPFLSIYKPGSMREGGIAAMLEAIPGNPAGSDQRHKRSRYGALQSNASADVRFGANND
jgi:hypothetical protein